MSNNVSLIIALVLPVVLCAIAFIAAYSKRSNADEEERTDIFIVRLENTDCSIREATNYLKRTNSCVNGFKQSKPKQ